MTIKTWMCVFACICTRALAAQETFNEIEGPVAQKWLYSSFTIVLEIRKKKLDVNDKSVKVTYERK